MTLNRRSFIKSSVGGAAGITLGGTGVKSVLGKSQQSGSAWSDKKPINPDIDNMRVVCMHDPEMCSEPTGSAFATVNGVVNEKKVSSNMDLMAMELAGKTSAEDAWKTIFRSSKPWNATKVMLKVNAVEKVMLARVAVIKKIADVLIGFGVKPENMVLFDGQGGDWGQYKNFVSLTDATKIRAVLSNKYDSLGGQASITIPGIQNQGYAPKDLVEGVTDIIVNIAVNKGHASPTFHVGMTTLCLKNHFGTFLRNSSFGLMADHLHSTAGLININKTEAIVGGNPVRQQLCIIDTLWGCKSGPGAANGAVLNAEGKLNRLIMGTFAGAVDYCCAKKVREELQNVTDHESAVIDKFLTEFGYKVTDPVWVEMTPTGTTIGNATPVEAGKKISVSLSNTSLRSSTITCQLPAGSHDMVSVTIFDVRGARVRELAAKNGTELLIWDGKATNGSVVRPGTYIISITSGNFTTAGKMTLMR